MCTALDETILWDQSLAIVGNICRLQLMMPLLSNLQPCLWRQFETGHSFLLGILPQEFGQAHLASIMEMQVFLELAWNEGFQSELVPVGYNSLLLILRDALLYPEVIFLVPNWVCLQKALRAA